MRNGSFTWHSSLAVLCFTSVHFSINYGKWLLARLVVTQCFVSFGCRIILHGLSITFKVDDLWKRRHCPVISPHSISSPYKSSSLLANKGWFTTAKTLHDSSEDERSPPALTIAVLHLNLCLFSFATRWDVGCVPCVSGLHHQGALASFQHLRCLYNVSRQEFVFYLQLKHFLLATLQDYLLPLATDLESLFLRLMSVKGFVLKCCCLFHCNNSDAFLELGEMGWEADWKMAGGKDVGHPCWLRTQLHI